MNDEQPHELLGQHFAVVSRSRDFPHDFTVVAVGNLSLRIKNAIEEYTVTRIRFNAEHGKTFVPKTDAA